MITKFFFTENGLFAKILSKKNTMGLNLIKNANFEKQLLYKKIIFFVFQGKSYIKKGISKFQRNFGVAQWHQYLLLLSINTLLFGSNTW